MLCYVVLQLERNTIESPRVIEITKESEEKKMGEGLGIEPVY
mgnify:CR=1 FL=1